MSALARRRKRPRFCNPCSARLFHCSAGRSQEKPYTSTQQACRKLVDPRGRAPWLGPQEAFTSPRFARVDVLYLYNDQCCLLFANYKYTVDSAATFFLHRLAIPAV